jgi:DNA repair exonuclease SbcCD ATPase subunit
LGLEVNVDKIPELEDVIEFSRNFIRKLDVFYDGLTIDQVKYITVDYDPRKLSKLQMESEDITKNIELSKAKLLEFTDQLKSLTVLDDRPKNCKIDGCPFISEAIKISKTKSKESITQDLDKLQEKIQQYSVDLTENQNNIMIWNSMIPKRTEYGTLIELFKNIITKYPENSLLNSAYKDFEIKVSKLHSFNDLREVSNLIEGLNRLIELRDEIQKNQVIEASYKSHRDKIKLINSTKSNLESMKKEQEDLNIKIIELRKSISVSQDLVTSLSSNLGMEELYKSVYDDYLDTKTKFDSISEKLQQYEKKSAEALNALSVIEKYKEDLNKAQEELDPVKNSITDVTGRLTLLNNYLTEYNKYNESYQIIETLKKYCSPTGGGIQTIFMQLYMSKTLELSNQILAMLFNGEYQLIDFVINENEFRIPFIGNGLVVDDISSGSNSQVCMMGMVINLVLLHQASTKYNIAYLDEIDAGLDHRNRFEFVDALYKTIPLLNIEQLFMISHSMETDTSSVDIIKLKGYEDFEDTVQMGNVIFDYNEL